MSLLADLVDGFYAIFSPAAAAERQFARMALRESARLVGHREASTTRLDRPSSPRGTSGDYELELGYDRRSLVDRARALERNNVLAGALLDCACDSVVGDGFKLRARTEDHNYNKALEELWREWAENDADVRGLLSFDDILSLLYRSEERDGDVAVVLNADGSLRVVESDEIASPTGGYYKPSMADGVELDANGKPIAFWIFNPDPNVLYADRRNALNRIVRVPAEHVIFSARRTRSSQTRGISVFNGMIGLLDQLDGTVEAVTVAHRMAALFSLVVKKKSPFSGALMRADANGVNRPQLNFEPGSIMRLEPDEDVQQITPAHPGAQSAQHLRDLGRIASSRFEIPFEFVIRDLTIGNYSNYRTGLILMKKARVRKQKRLARIASAIYTWKVIRWMEEGRIPVRKDALLHHWVKPGTPWLDPVAEFQTALGAIDAGMNTLTRQAGDQGMELEDLLDEREREIGELEKRGIPIVRSTLTRDPAPPPSEEESDGDEGDDEADDEKKKPKKDAKDAKKKSAA